MLLKKRENEEAGEKISASAKELGRRVTRPGEGGTKGEGWWLLSQDLHDSKDFLRVSPEGPKKKNK